MATKRKSVNVPMEDRDWRAEGDFRTLMEADAIKRDPKRFAAAQAVAKDHVMRSASVAGQAAPDSKS